MLEPWQNLSLKNIAGEKWKYIKGFDRQYLISNMGRVKSLVNYFKSVGIRILKQGLDTDGYPQVVLRKNKISYPKKPHRLVALHFIPNPKKKPHVNHKKGIKTDNRKTELEWATESENVQHSFDVLGRKGYSANKGLLGELNWNSKKVNQINLQTGAVISTFYGTAEAARKLNMSRRSIGRAASGERATYKGFKWEYAK